MKPLSDGDLRSWKDLAEQAARRSGDALMRLREQGPEVLAEPARDIKLSADHESEELIVEMLRSATSLPILSEERLLTDGTTTADDLRWIVDPLDGSLNYLRGIPMHCVSIAMWSGDEPLIGVVWDFSKAEMFSGIVGVGAWCNGEPMRVSPVNDVGRAVMATGFPTMTDFSPSSLTKFVEEIRKFKKVRLLGSAALSLAYIAAGRVDAYSEEDIRVWDIAAGTALVLAAGGHIEKTGVSDKHTLTVYAENGNLQ